MTIAMAAARQDFNHPRSAENDSNALEWPVSGGALALGLEGVSLPSVMAINNDTDVDCAPAQVSEQGPYSQVPNSRGSFVSRVTRFAEQHPTIFWSTTAVAAFGLATAASTVAASSGGVLLPALAITAKFGATLATALAVRDVSLMVPWLAPSSH